MADPAAIRGALKRIGFFQQARTYIVNNQGIDEIEELRILTDEEVENLCKNVRCPGGYDTQPSSQARTAESDSEPRNTCIAEGRE